MRVRDGVFDLADLEWPSVGLCVTVNKVGVLLVVMCPESDMVLSLDCSFVGVIRRVIVSLREDVSVSDCDSECEVDGL